MQDFSKPLGSDFIISLRCTDGSYNLFFQGAQIKNGKRFVRYTSKIEDAFRMTEAVAKSQSVNFTALRPRVEFVAADNSRQVVA